MAQPKRQKKITAITIAADLHKHHTHAELAHQQNPQQIVFTEENVIKILTNLGHPPPDFEGYAKIAKSSPQGYMSRRKELLNITSRIKDGMDKKKLNNSQFAEAMGLSNGAITRILSGANITAHTMLKIERVLDIKLLNH